ncbi:hypothetical protein BGZ65_012744 [Modicella reniformis]|uniref:Hepatocellular carcinoma-associated antigen 59 n=1 Tax=Modicella reniformis TaxID=1440133 RepID=A0A9P6M1J0_9FUNG|nr:hypothetical protein BGZ65_012744 [Modicella reniformis]
MGGDTKRRNYRRREATPEEPIDESANTSGSTEGPPKSKDEGPEGLSLDEMLELRKLRQRPSGLAAADLLVGDPTEKKKKKDKVVAADPWKLSSGGGLVDLDEVRRQEDGSSGKSTGILNSFTKQTNALDVDKHMMQYIEDEMKKRKGETVSEDKEEQTRSSNADTDILEGLGIKKTAPKPEQEGNVQLSTTMLTAIPEVDLGMEARLRNIEDTEKAKRKLYEQRTTTTISSERFSQPAYVPSDRERLSQNNRRNNSGNSQFADMGSGPNHRFQNTYGNPSGQNDRGGVGRGMATDDLVMERFKKRMRR